MSLIHEALKANSAQSQGAKSMSSPKPNRSADASGRPAWFDGLLSFIVVVGLGVLGWYAWQGITGSKTTVQSESAAVSSLDEQAQHRMAASASSLDSAAMLESGTAADLTATDPAAQQTTASEEWGATEAEAASPMSGSAMAPSASTSESDVLVSAPAITQTATPRPRPVRRAAAPAPASPPPAPEPSLESRFANFVTAIREDRTRDVQKEYAGLRARLPEGSLMLLRAQAWYELHMGRDESAADTYRRILERLPGDKEAAINLASIQARHQQTEEARATLDAAARLQPDSLELQSALSQFSQTERQ